LDSEQEILTNDELLETKTQEEISTYCGECGLCCWLPSTGVFSEIESSTKAKLNWSKTIVDKDYWVEECEPCPHLQITPKKEPDISNE
jgi:hypothetical protein